MSTLKVQIPDEMDEDIESYLDAHPHYMNKSELVRDALRHLLEEPPVAKWVREDIKVAHVQMEHGETVALDNLE